MNRAPFRSAREAFLRSPQRLVNFFFRFSENFFSASREAFRHREIRFYENFASPVKTFFQFFSINRLVAHRELEAGAFAQLAVAYEVGAVSPAVEAAIFRVRF